MKAETGTGKTVVYLAPIIHKLQANMKTISRSDGTFGRYAECEKRMLCSFVMGAMSETQ